MPRIMTVFFCRPKATVCTECPLERETEHQHILGWQIQRNTQVDIENSILYQKTTNVKAH
jgi:hypothetical protein